MSFGANQIDRLLPRHPADAGLELTWNVHSARKGLFGKEEAYSHGTIQDLSLEGALVEVPDSQEHDVGTVIDVRFRGNDGRAQICHQRAGDDGHVLYGVRFARDAGIKSALDQAVGELRGDSIALAQAWDRSN